MKKNNQDLSKIEKLYNDNLEKFGIDSRSVGWNSPGSQALRFEKLLEVVINKKQGFTLNELGCGYGELFKYCMQNDLNLERYFAYDISDKMLYAAKDYVNDKRAEFYNKSTIVTKADYTITSGIFNVKFDVGSKDWETYIKDTLVNMFDNSYKGASFNLLTKYVDFEAENLYYADPCYFFDFCKRELSRKTNLIHDYNLFEWTICVFK